MAAPLNGTTLDNLYEIMEEVRDALGGLTVEAPEGGATEITLVRVADAVETSAPAATIGLLTPNTPTITVDDDPNYTTGMGIGGLITLTNIARAAGKTGYITALNLKSKAAITVLIDAFFFNADPAASTVSDQGTFSVHANDLAKLIGSAEFLAADWKALGGTAVQNYVDNCRIATAGQASDDLYMVLVARGTINFASTSDLILDVFLDQN